MTVTRTEEITTVDEDPFAPEESEDAFAPASEGQLVYLRTMLRRLSAHDWSSVPSSRTRSVITLLNEARKKAGVPYKPIEGLGG